MIAASSLMLPLQSSASASTSVVEFEPGEVRSQGWKVVNDGVMGGLSKGNIRVSDEGILTFSGDLSLENNGGFSSIRTENFKKDLSEAAGFMARVKGDGRTYQMRVYTDARYRGMRVSFKSDFKTKKGEWTEVKVPFDSFAGSFRGMSLKEEVFDPAKVEGLGLLLADKKAGEFKLEVDWIRSYGAGKGNDVIATALADGRFGTLAKALTEAELVKALQSDGPFTVFAPTDEAFAKLPEETLKSLLQPENRGKLQEILKFHVIGGTIDLAGALSAGEAATLQGAPVRVSFSEGKVKVNEASLVNADIRCSNGIIHVIDSVILPPEPANDLLSVAKRAGKFKTLLAAVEAAGLVDIISGDQNLTVFAPTDEAFAALPEGTVENLLKKENLDQLRAILAFHVVSGNVSAGDALNAKSAKALNGGALQFQIEDGRFKVNGATIKAVDVACDNGTIHIIDSVLLPTKEVKKKNGPHAAMQEIENAIEIGVPVFNNGNHEKCARIYRDCMIGISGTCEMDERINNALGELVKRADKIEDDTERAWVLRGGLDHLYSILSKH